MDQPPYKSQPDKTEHRLETQAAQATAPDKTHKLSVEQIAEMILQIEEQQSVLDASPEHLNQLEQMKQRLLTKYNIPYEQLKQKLHEAQ